MGLVSHKVRILLIKPYEPAHGLAMQPPVGILYLISALRREFGEDVEATYRDLRLHHEVPESFVERMEGDYDLVGISALNHEAEATHRLVKAIKAARPETLVVVGGPYARSAPDRIMAAAGADWIFRGESDRTFPQAVREHFYGAGELGTIPGLIWRRSPDEEYRLNAGEDSIEDVGSLPFPAWDLVPFDLYARRQNMNVSLRASRYAPIFTSRGCPYRCNYCHDLFGKGFRWRGVDSVMEEIELLTERYGVREFQIIDDIYNLHKPRMREIARRVIARYGKRSLYFCFPNGVRSDIIDVADLPLLRDMGVYDMSIAVETVSPRLQKLIDKNLDIPKVRRVIDAAARAGISTKGFFMLGFPTETLAEMEATVQFAVDSKLTMAHFFFVVPQKGTPLYDLAQREAPGALEKVSLRDYYTEQPWYQLAYGVDMNRIISRAVFRFHGKPSRILAIAKRTNFLNLLGGAWSVFRRSILFVLRPNRRVKAPTQSAPA